MIKERRKHPRLRIPLEAEYLVAGKDEWREGTIWTLGAGGAALLCEERLKKGTRLEGLHFVVAADGDLPETRIEVGAEVVSIERGGDFGRPSSFMLGLQFTELGKQEFGLLRKFVFKRLTGAQKQNDDPEAEPQEKTAAPPIEIRFKLFDEFVEEVSENLSPSGMFIRAHRPLPPGSQFVFEFQLGEDFSLFQGTAEVVWTRRRSEGPDRPAGMGVRFVKLDLTSQKLVKRLVGQRKTGAAPGAAESATALKLSGNAEPFAIDTEPRVAKDEEPGAESATEERQPRRLARLAKKLKRAEAAREKAQEQFKSLREESKSLRDESKSLRKEAESLRDTVSTLESSHGEERSGRERAEAEAAELREQLEAHAAPGDVDEKLQRSREELERRQEEWDRQEAELREELERRSAGEVEFQERLEQAMETEAELEQRLEQAESSRRELEKKLDRTQEIEDDLDRVRLEWEEASKEWKFTKSELRSRLKQQSAGEAELKERLDLADEREAELSQRVEGLEEKRAELEERLGGVEGVEEELERARREAAEATEEWEATEAQLRAQLEQSSASKAELAERLSEAAATETQLRQQLSEAGEAREELDQVVSRSAEVEAVMREQVQELRASRDELEAKLARATEQLGAIQSAAEKMKLRLNGDLSAAQDLETDLAAKLAEVAELGSGLEKKLGSLTTARAKLARRLRRLTGAWESLEEGLAEVDVEAASGDDSPAAPAESVPENVQESMPEKVDPPAESPPLVESVSAAVGEADVAPPPPEAALASVPSDILTVAPDLVAEPAIHQPEAEDEAEQTADETPVTAPTGAARLVGVARRAAARLGFARRSAADGNGGEPEPQPPAPAGTVQETAATAPEQVAGPGDIEETVRAWAAAWSEQRVTDYLSFYSREFEAARGDGDEDDDSAAAPHAWMPPLAGMELTLGPISQSELAPGRFAVQFEQSVETDSYTRRTGRTLEMVLEADAWKIAAESFQDLPSPDPS